MNWKNLTLISGIALGLIAVPAAEAQRSGNRAGATTSNARTQSSVSSGGRTQFAHRGDRWRGGGDRGDRWRNRGDGNRNRWDNHRGGNWRHRRHYPRYYPRYSSFYGYPFGYGYPLGYGYGYPYFGASAALYYNGYHPYRSAGYARGGSVVAEVQQELARAGYYRGAIDGIIGQGTRNAIRAYERAHGLRVDGRIDQELLGAMGLG